MSASEVNQCLCAAWERARHGCRDDQDYPKIRRAFRRAVSALDNGDPRPALLLVYRWP